MSEEIKPCPFCGITEKFLERTSIHRLSWPEVRPIVVTDVLLTGQYYVRCQNCGAVILNGGESTIERAIAGWNERPPQ